MSGDGSYSNRTVLRQLPERTTFIGRIRKDAILFLALPPLTATRSGDRPRRYGAPAHTPEQVLHDATVPVVKVRCFAARQVRKIPVKVVRTVYWRKAGPDLPLLLIVMKPLGDRLRQGSKLLYRQPAFLICTDPQLDLPILLQAYIDRWEIECNHRDEKSLLGAAQGQVWNPLAVAVCRNSRWPFTACCCWLPSWPMGFSAPPSIYHYRGGEESPSVPRSWTC